MSTVVPYCWCRSDSASVLLYFTFLSHLLPLPCGAGSTVPPQVLLCLFPGVLWLWHFLYSVGPHPAPSLHIYTFVVLQAFMAGAAGQAGDAESFRAPGLTSGLQGSVNVHPGALLLVPQWQGISSFVFYLDLSLSIGKNGKFYTSVYDKRNEFNFNVTNSLILSSYISSSLAYGVLISQLNDMSVCAILRNLSFWEPCDFSISCLNKDTPQNA